MCPTNGFAVVKNVSMFLQTSRQGLPSRSHACAKTTATQLQLWLPPHSHQGCSERDFARNHAVHGSVGASGLSTTHCARPRTKSHRRIFVIRICILRMTRNLHDSASRRCRQVHRPRIICDRRAAPAPGARPSAVGVKLPQKLIALGIADAARWPNALSSGPPTIAILAPYFASRNRPTSTNRAKGHLRRRCAAPTPSAIDEFTARHAIQLQRPPNRFAIALRQPKFQARIPHRPAGKPQQIQVSLHFMFRRRIMGDIRHQQIKSAIQFALRAQNIFRIRNSPTGAAENPEIGGVIKVRRPTAESPPNQIGAARRCRREKRSASSTRPKINGRAAK